MPIDSLKPRKTPRQARATATVAAIFEATFQVLRSDGFVSLTTTRVAERAGVSVGTMYQYFPHKHALLYAVLEQYVQDVVLAMEEACARFAGTPLAEMSDGLVNAYLAAKLRHLPGSRVLYVVAAELETASLVDDVTQRVDRALRQLLETVPGVAFEQLDQVTVGLRALLVGTVRAVLEDDGSPAAIAMVREQLPVMCRAYLLASSTGLGLA
jgi:AcrR family transcriptional regulator